MKFNKSNILNYLRVLIPAFFGVLVIISTSFAQTSKSKPVEVSLVTDEAEAVLSILEKRKTNQNVSEADWQRLFDSEGYTRLKKRETSLEIPFEDAEFKAFVLSEDLLARLPVLAETLAKWKRVSVDGAARRALAYLPKQSRIRAKLYPVIKPKDNTFVFDVTTDPAIFFYLDPSVTKEQFENTLAHELHHIGYVGSCPVKHATEERASLPQNVRTVLGHIGRFGEGFAMLAAAGDPKIHPHKFSIPEDRVRWDRDMFNFNADLKTVEKFFLDVLDNKLDKQDETRTAFSFYGVQGAWYTVGWKMSVMSEKEFGRKKLIECICDQRKLLATYNLAATKYNKSAREPLAIWSRKIATSFDGQPKQVSD